MKRNRLFPAICLVAALLLSACSQDEPTENSTALPEGEYPLQIGSVTLTAEVSEQPWTRVSENPTNGMSSVWTHDDKIGVRIGDDEETGIYVVKLDAEGTVMEVVPEKPVYWKDKQPATITAWYPVKEELDFTHQDNGLTYLLQATGDGNYQSTPINLNFTHQLAKVRVELTGTKSNEVQQVYVRSYPKSVNNQGDLGETTGGDPIYVPMLKADYEGETYWEANLLKGYLDADNTFRVSSDGKNFVQAKLTTDVDITPGYVHTININVGEAQQVTGEISDDGTYIVSGTREEPVNITGGSPTIYLKDANINVSDSPAINITSGNPTIHVFGESNTVTSSNSAGIYVAENATVTITGSNRSDVLTVTGNEGSSGIGGYVIDDSSFQSANSGNINIKNVTLYAYSSSLSDMGTVSPGIGSTGSATCQSITIDNAVVYAYGCGLSSMSAPAIGNGIDWIENTASATPTVTISNNSEVHAHRGESGGRSFADYIGRAGVLASPYSNVKASVDATSVVYKYTGYGNTPDQ